MPFFHFLLSKPKHKKSFFSEGQIIRISLNLILNAPWVPLTRNTILVQVSILRVRPLQSRTVICFDSCQIFEDFASYSFQVSLRHQFWTDFKKNLDFVFLPPGLSNFWLGAWFPFDKGQLKDHYYSKWVINLYFTSELEHNFFKNVSKGLAFSRRTQIQTLEYGLDDAMRIKKERPCIDRILIYTL